MAGIVSNVVINDEHNQKDYYDNASHYDRVWGADNIHLGYYPHIASKDLVQLDNVQAADALTRRMIEMARIVHTSTVLDLGCGKGQSMKVVAENTGASVTGIDLSTTNIVRANEVAKSLPHLRQTFYEGSFTQLPKEVLAQKYSVIFSQVAFCHVHRELPATFEELKRVLAPGGCLVVNDYLGGKRPASTRTKENVHKRLHFEYLHPHQEWRRIAEAAGFVIEVYEDLDKHMAQTYRDMERKARKLGLKSTDGALLADNYGETVRAIEQGEIGMNVALLRLGLPKPQDTLADTSRVYLKKDAYGGVGAFARTAIFKGELIEKGLARRLPPSFDGNEDKNCFCWSQSEPRTWAMLGGFAIFYNMSDEPNCDMKRFFDEDRWEIYANRDIKQDEELTHVYISSSWRKCFAELKPILESYHKKQKMLQSKL